MVGKGSHFYCHYLQPITYKGHHVLKTYHKVISNDVGNHKIHHLHLHNIVWESHYCVYIPQCFNEDCWMKTVKII
jgi:hypothetical protein